MNTPRTPLPLMFGIPDDGMAQIYFQPGKPGPQVSFPGNLNFVGYLDRSRGPWFQPIYCGPRLATTVDEVEPGRPVVNAVTEPHRCSVALRTIEAVVAKTQANCFNHPAAIQGTRRDLVSERLAGIEGLCMPRTLRLRIDEPAELGEAIARAGLGYVPEDRRIFSDLTVLENLDVGRQPARQWPDGTAAPTWTPEALFQLFPNLGEMPQRPGGRMSGGEQQMLTVARTLMGNPYLVLLDEPSEGVAPVIVEQMAHMILELKEQGVSILLSEQNMHFAELVSDRAYVLEKGQIRYQASMEELAANEEVRRAYLSV